MHRTVRKSFLRKPYTVSNLMDVWECDLLNMQYLSLYNYTYSYILFVFDVFSEYLHLVLIKTKRGPAVSSAFPSLLHDDSRRPLWVRTDKAKEFLNKHFQEMLRAEGIQFQVCSYHDVKCAVVERVHKTIRDRLFKYFTFSNSYRYIYVLPKFVKAYNDTVHTNGIAPSRMPDAEFLAI